MKTTTRWQKWLTLIAVSIVLASTGSAYAHHSPGHGGGGGGGGGGDGDDGGGTFTGPRIVFAGNTCTKIKGQTTCSWEAYSANADGSDRVRLTDDMSTQYWPTSWSRDGWMIASGHVLDVGDGTDPNAVVEVAEFTGGSKTPVYHAFSEYMSGGSVLPAAQQRIQATEGTNEVNIVLRMYDGSDPVPVTSYVSSYIPGVENTGTYYEVKWPAWLPAGPGSTIRLVYGLKVFNIVEGSADSLGPGHGTLRVVTLDTTAWPSVTVISDELLAGYEDVGSARFNFSRDGTRIAYGGSSGFDLKVAPVEYDASGVPTLRTDLAWVIDDAGTDPFVYQHGTFSLDNSLFSFQASVADGKFGGRSVNAYVIDATGPGATPVEVDGLDTNAGHGVFGP